MACNVEQRFLKCRQQELPADVRARCDAAACLLKTIAQLDAVIHTRSPPPNKKECNNVTRKPRRTCDASVPTLRSDPRKTTCPVRALTALMNKCTAGTSRGLLKKYRLRYDEDVLDSYADKLADVVIAKCIFHPQFDEVYRTVLQGLSQTLPRTAAVLHARIRDLETVILSDIEHPQNVSAPRTKRTFFSRLELVLTGMNTGFTQPGTSRRIITALIRNIDRLLLDADDNDVHSKREVLLQATKQTLKHVDGTEAREVRSYMTTLHDRIVSGALKFDNKCRFIVLDIKA